MCEAHEELLATHQKLLEKIEELERNQKQLKHANQQLAIQNEKLRSENEKLKTKLAKLEGKTRAEAYAEVYGKPEARTSKGTPGREEGHEGVGRQLPAKIDSHKKLSPLKKCPHCGHPVKVRRYRKRTLIDLKPGTLQATEYDIPQCYCPNCHKTVEPKVETALPNSRFGLTFALWIACLRMLGVSVDKILFLLQADYGLHVSSATIINTCNKLAEFLGDDYEQFRKELLKEKALNCDETSWRNNGKNNWLWNFVGKKVAFFTIDRSRSHTVPERVLKGYTGIVSSDFWSGYNSLPCEKQKCWVHLKRELRRVRQRNKSKEFASFKRCLDRLYRWARTHRRYGKRAQALAEERLHAIAYDAYADKDCRRLVKRLKRHEKEMFTFVGRRGVKPHNNDAERSIRSAVVVRKNSFGSRSDNGAESFARLETFFQTAQLRGENFHDFVGNLVEERLKN
jgi:transposase